MKKNILILAAVILLIPMFLPLHISIKCLDIAAIFFLCVSCLGLKKYKSYRADLVPNIFENLIRNYNELTLGDRDDVPSLHNNDVLHLDGYYRCFYSDYLILQRFYSMLKNGGTVRLHINCKRRAYFDKSTIPFLDYGFMHRVTMMENHISKTGLSYKMNKFFSIYKVLFHKWRIEYHDDETVIKWLTKGLPKMVDFCEKRNLKLIIMVKNDTSEIRKVFAQNVQSNNVEICFERLNDRQ